MLGENSPGRVERAGSPSRLLDSLDSSRPHVQRITELQSIFTLGDPPTRASYRGRDYAPSAHLRTATTPESNTDTGEHGSFYDALDDDEAEGSQLNLTRVGHAMVEF